MRPTPRRRSTVWLAPVVAAVLLGGCVDASTDELVEEPDGSAGASLEDTAEGGVDATVPQVPPLLDGPDGIDHWDETIVDVGDGTLRVDAKVADTRERRQQGLMRVEDLPDGAGMLFLFDELRGGGFWMKDTLVPLDIAYIAGDEVVSILQMDPCEEDPCPTFDPGVDYDAALEVRQGLFADAGVSEGDPVTWIDPVPADDTA